MSTISMYTDGGAEPNPGLGGWAVVILQDNTLVKSIHGSEPETSNNRMELTAAIKGLKSTDPGQKLELYTDSNYLRQGITDWIKKWKQNGWLTADKKPVKNQDLWIELDTLVEQRQIEWKWVKGHNGNEWNEYVDNLVHKAREEAKQETSL